MYLLMVGYTLMKSYERLFMSPFAMKNISLLERKICF